ncbi:MAG: 3-keto-5-aminohexanoate cleavage protein [Symbiobacterium sp.]|uniref:3-keto-5-aminohexanoate cleavage enzyme n=1 Tax=Symbiobacterium sp. TaxID=1971213 RepID=UPI00346431CE
MEKLIITVALNGAEVTRAKNPNIPYTPEELAEDAARCRDAGAAMVHVHGRLPDGTPTQDAGVYQRILEAIRARTDVIVQVSTGGAVGMGAEERLAPVRLRPEMASLTTGTVNFGDSVFSNPPDLIEQFARTMRDYGVVPEIECFDVGHIDNALALVKREILTLPLHFDFVMGVSGGIAPTVRNLVHMSESLPPGCTWSVAGIGRAQLPLATVAIVMGGHVRVGLEDNLYYTRGVPATNAMLVERIVRLARELGREVATPEEARRILRLPQRRS